MWGQVKFSHMYYPNSPYNSMPKSEAQSPKISLEQAEAYTKYLSGRVKTIIDASIADPKQNKAMKNLITNAIWNGGFETLVDWASCEGTDKIHVLFPFYNGPEAE